MGQAAKRDGQVFQDGQRMHAVQRRRRAAETPSLSFSFVSPEGEPVPEAPSKGRKTRSRGSSTAHRKKGSRKGRKNDRPKPSSRTSGVTEPLPADLIACVHLPELPLQILLRDQPTWRRGPAAVVPEDRPDAPLIHLNQVAWRGGLRPGIRYGAAKQLVPGLHAAPVQRETVLALAAELTEALRTFSPKVEGAEGTFYLDPSGLSHIYPSIEDWGLAIAAYLKGRGLRGGLVICEGRYRALALARAKSRSSRVSVQVLLDKQDADQRLHRVLLEELDISPTLRTALDQLALRTVGDLLAVRPGELASRLGAEASSLHAKLLGEQQLGLQPTPSEPPLRVQFEVEPPHADQERLLFHIKGALHGLLAEVESLGKVLTALNIEVTFEGTSSLIPDQHPEDRRETQRIEPARGTRDLMMLLELVRLRLGAWNLQGPVEGVCLKAETEQAEGDQLHMFSCPKRDPAAANRALARLRAVFGESAVTKPVLREAHLPEASFGWEPVRTIPLPQKGAAKKEHLQPPSNTNDTPPLIRRLLHKPIAIQTQGQDPTSNSFANSFANSFGSLFGPYRVSGGWWARPILKNAAAQPIERDYYYAEVGNELLWLYYDRVQEHWYLQGSVD